MNASRHPLTVSNVLASVATCLVLAAPALGQLTPNQLGTPDDGVVCRSGYTGSLTNGAFKCTKTRTITVQLECVDSRFPRYVIRPQGSPNTTVGQDLCTRNAVLLGSTDPIGNLIQGEDFVNAAVDPARVANRVATLHAEEARALGLDANTEVETIAGDPVIQYNQAAGSRDNARVPVTFYTFAIRTGVRASTAPR